MAAPTITLGFKEILLTQKASGLGITPINNQIQFGNVEKINDLSDGFTVGDSVMFDVTKTRSFIYGSTIYYIANEENISGTEVIVP